jgi:hypothetical protein
MPTSRESQTQFCQTNSMNPFRAATTVSGDFYLPAPSDISGRVLSIYMRKLRVNELTLRMKDKKLFLHSDSP